MNINHLMYGLVAVLVALTLFFALTSEADAEYFFTPYHSPDQYAWAGTKDTGYYKVYYAETDTDTIESLCSTFESPQGCHAIIPAVGHQQYHLVAIPFKGGYDYYEGLVGCNIYTHETLHAWGYKETMLHHFFTCGKPSQYTELPILGVTRQ